MFTRIAGNRTRGWLLPALISAALLVSLNITSSVTKYHPQEDGKTKPNLNAQQNLALSFELNGGQASAPTRFIARAPGSTIYFSPSEVAIVIETTTDQGADTMDDKGASSASDSSLDLMASSRFNA